jgi:hypothetical protein
MRWVKDRALSVVSSVRITFSKAYHGASEVNIVIFVVVFLEHAFVRIVEGKYDGRR